MKKKLIVLSGFVLGLAPVMALAQVPAGVVTGDAPETCPAGLATTTIQGVMCKVANILEAIIPILIILGILYFVYGVISYVIAGDAEASTKGRDRIIYGIVGLAVIVGMWGLVYILTNTFGLKNTSTINFPTVPY